MTSPPQDPFDPGAGRSDLPPTAPPAPPQPPIEETTPPPMPPVTGRTGPTDTGADDGGKASQAADAAKEQGKELAGSAKSQAADVAGTVKEQASQVVGDAAAQARGLVSSATHEIQEQAEAQTSKLAQTMDRTSDQILALAEGRTEDAGQMEDIVRQLAQSVSQWADRVDSLGASGIVDEARRFARRRPGAFLASAATAGFLVSRFVRNASDDSQGGSGRGDHQRGLPARTGVPGPMATGPTVTGPTVTGPAGVGGTAGGGLTPPAGAPPAGTTTPPPHVPSAPGEAGPGRDDAPFVDLVDDPVDSERF